MYLLLLIIFTLYLIKYVCWEICSQIKKADRMMAVSIKYLHNTLVETFLRFTHYMMHDGVVW